ncbi:hypothetical protein GQ53DRAFT_847092 [Thozetella sp. PMI_491]|nr:hypothetical protein GQ53DRAFT_847092 [Thozetella sp. PMI_491]
MEAAGLAVGVVALASLFRGCLDLFAYISATKSIGYDYELLDTKLNIEKTIFLQWASHVRLFEENYIRLLDEAGVCRSVSTALLAIQGLLSDGKNLQQHYGVRPAEANEFNDVIPVISGPRMASVVRSFQAMTLQEGKRGELQRLRWVVRDKDKFDELLRQLSYFNSKLNELVPESEQNVILMVQSDLEDLGSICKMKLVAQAATSQEQMALWYRTMHVRREQVAIAHSKTFIWALEASKDSIHWDSLESWLYRGSGLYWVSGKAGSGKSTLMKFLYGHERTRNLLKIWSGDRDLTISSFFFWSLGGPEQGSQDGLLRALLYDILLSDPTLIPEILPAMWREVQTSDSEDPAVPSPLEMETALQNLISHAGNIRKYCFFIDGLDEFSGRHEDTIAFLTNLVQTPNFKIIVSSRPIPSCVDAFSNNPKLRHQDLTRGDIQSYVSETIRSHRHVQSLLCSDAQWAEQIINDIVGKASGVFLWVVLACRSVRQGFTAYDHLSEIQKRIDELPPELKDLFTHMLGKIEARYREQAAKLLRLCYESRLYNSSEPLQTLGVALIDDVTEIFIQKGADTIIGKDWVGDSLPAIINRKFVNFAAENITLSMKDRGHVSDSGRRLLRLVEKPAGAERRLANSRDDLAL